MVLYKSIKRKSLVSMAILSIASSLAFGAGEIKDGKVCTYLEGSLQDVAAVEKTLQSAGFDTLASYPIDAAGKLTTVVFTNAKLKSMANKPNRGHAATLRVLIDKIDNQISITNPLYFEKAFLQKDYDEAGAKAVLAKINTAFQNLKDSKDNMRFNALAKYHFMFGMPYYDDMATVGKGANSALLQKAKAYEGGKNIVFTLKLSNDRILLGYKITQETANFVKKIGTKNAALLPYTILIENNKARILAGKYYIAVSYPSLAMGDFMKIATIPGAIESDCEKPFQ